MHASVKLAVTIYFAMTNSISLAQKSSFSLSCNSVDRIDSMALIKVEYQESANGAQASISGAFVEGGVFHPILKGSVKKIRPVFEEIKSLRIRSRKIDLKYHRKSSEASLITRKWVERPLPYGCHWCLFSVPLLQTKTYKLNHCAIEIK